VDAARIRARIDEWAAQDLSPQLRRAAPDGGIETLPLCAVPALNPEPGGLAESVALRLAGANRTETASFTSEAGQFQEVGISTVLCGPGSISEAHQPNEYIEVDQIAACETFLLRLADWAAS
jgi:acetylornithine deacetylase